IGTWPPRREKEERKNTRPPRRERTRRRGAVVFTPYQLACRYVEPEIPEPYAPRRQEHPVPLPSCQGVSPYRRNIGFVPFFKYLCFSSILRKTMIRSFGTFIKISGNFGRLSSRFRAPPRTLPFATKLRTPRAPARDVNDFCQRGGAK